MTLDNFLPAKALRVVCAPMHSSALLILALLLALIVLPACATGLDTRVSVLLTDLLSEVQAPPMMGLEWAGIAIQLGMSTAADLLAALHEPSAQGAHSERWASFISRETLVGIGVPRI